MKLLIKFIFNTIRTVATISCFNCCSYAQQPYPQNYFSSPLAIPLKLAGNFGEIRSGHYHSGIDIKTDSVIGKEVFSAADGYVSRIKISSVGFGKAIYITHPNRLVTVYAHLHHFKDSINAFVLDNQYIKESFETELFPDSNQFRVKKGECIAWSGNTGGSEGPHLHFEIRDARTEKPINPLFFGYAIPDTIAPVLESIILYPIAAPQMLDSSLNREEVITTTVNQVDTINGIGKFGLQFKGYDLANDGANHLGIYSISLYGNDSLLFSLKQSTFAFEETKYCNAHIDYKRKFFDNVIYERCYRLPGDTFSLLQNLSDDGIFQIDTGKTIRLLLVLEDYAKNRTTREIVVLGKSLSVPASQLPKVSRIPKEIRQDSTLLVRWNKKTYYHSGFISIKIPEKALYEDAYLTFGFEKKKENNFGPENIIGSSVIPLNAACSITLKPVTVSDSLKDKVILVRKNRNAGASYVPSEFRGDSITANLRTFGNYFISYDTIAPEISHYKLECDTVFNRQLLTVKIYEKESAIASYRATLDGQWILMEFDEKTGTLFYTFDQDNEVEGKAIRIEVTDRKQNRSVAEDTVKF